MFEEERDLQLPVSAADFSGELLHWYEEHQRRLPWRENPDPYWVWVSEVMLQQTQVSTVLPYFDNFIKRFPTLSDLAESDLDELLDLWAGLGYYRRARHLHKAAKLIRRHYQGTLPQSYEDLLALPGIGKYTAGAILSIAFGQAYPILDGNIRRLLARYLAIDRKLGHQERARLWRFLSQIVVEPSIRGRIAEFNQALMELGALVCLPKNPRCPSCPLAGSCLAHEAGYEQSLPLKDRRRPVVKLGYIVALVRRNGSYLMHQRKEESYLKGFWDFPSIARESDDPEIIARRFCETHQLNLVFDCALEPVVHAITFRRLTFHPWAMHLRNEPPPSFHWVRPDHSRYPRAAYIFKILGRAENREP